MAEEKTTPEEESKGGNKKLIIIIAAAVVVLLILGGVAAFFLLGDKEDFIKSNPQVSLLHSSWSLLTRPEKKVSLLYKER